MGRRRTFLVGATVIVAAAIAAVGFLSLAGADPSPPAQTAAASTPTPNVSWPVPGKDPATGLVGFTWTVVEVVVDGQVVEVPASNVWIALNPGGEYLSYDGVNSGNGTYRLTERGFEARNVASTLKVTIGGAHGAERAVLERAIEAIDRHRDPIVTAVAGSRLTIDVGK